MGKHIITLRLYFDSGETSLVNVEIFRPATYAEATEIFKTIMTYDTFGFVDAVSGIYTHLRLKDFKKVEMHQVYEQR